MNQGQAAADEFEIVTNMTLYPKLLEFAEKLIGTQLTDERKEILVPLIDYIQKSTDQNNNVNLNFICTHNSRRSQFSQIWAQVAAHYYGIHANCFSGGVEETAFNERAVASLKRVGFRINSLGEKNPKYSVAFAPEVKSLSMFSKMYNDPTNLSNDFGAVMTCSHADENCPVINGAQKRIQLLYEDPKEFDDTVIEANKYDERSEQIATELFHVFSQINN